MTFLGMAFADSGAKRSKNVEIVENGQSTVFCARKFPMRTQIDLPQDKLHWCHVLGAGIMKLNGAGGLAKCVARKMCPVCVSVLDQSVWLAAWRGGRLNPGKFYISKFISHGLCWRYPLISWDP